MNSGRTKIQDVARVAGVSTATVSRTLSNPSVVSEKTRAAVLNAVKETGYRINRAARNLRTQRSGAILTLIPNIGNPFFSQIISGIEQVFSKAEYNVLVSDTVNIVEGGAHVMDFFQDGRADGIILLDGYLPEKEIESLRGSDVEHLIIYACEWTDSLGIPSIRSDNRSGAMQAVQHLAQLGHKRIGHLTGPETNILTSVRRDGFFEAAAKHQLDARAEWQFPGDFSLQSGVDAADAYLALKDRPTAVFASSDLMAMGFIGRVLDAGVNVPADLSVVGFDDIGLAAHFRPSLTTIRQNRHEIGRLSAETLLQRLQNPAAVDPEARYMIPVQLVERNSSAPPPDRQT